MASEDRNALPIRLVDTTATTALSENPPELPAEAETANEDVASTTLGKYSKKGIDRAETLKKQWTQHKYARYQEGRFSKDDDRDSVSGGGVESNDPRKRLSARESFKAGRSRGPLSPKAQTFHDKKENEEREVDILYENQRGFFICGIPLYSSNSLLNFDPAPWQTAEFKDSPVNITNAQVPDPTWSWAWKSWYVDMSHDVDEEGWEYSFSFNTTFSWHGSQPWFHSYVRRRRWLRQRVRCLAEHHVLKDGVHESHQLTQDYFTIHSAAREGSQSSYVDPNAMRNSFHITSAGNDNESEKDETEINNVTALLRTLKQTTMDRKKLDAVRSFLAHGGDELYYLPDAMEEIMKLFMYQTTRRQLAKDLEQAAAGLRRDITDTEDGGGGEHEKEDKQASGIHRALAAVDEYIRDQEYWSDVKGTISPISGLDSPSSPAKTKTGSSSALEDVVPSAAAAPAPADDSWGPSSPIRESNEAGAAIKGIPGQADIGRDTGLLGRLGLAGGGAQQQRQQPRELDLRPEKVKGKEEEGHEEQKAHRDSEDDGGDSLD